MINYIELPLKRALEVYKPLKSMLNGCIDFDDDKYIVRFSSDFIEVGYASDNEWSLK